MMSEPCCRPQEFSGSLLVAEVSTRVTALQSRGVHDGAHTHHAMVGRPEHRPVEMHADFRWRQIVTS
jgi:hypothetical protein